MEAWKISFLSKWVICRFHVNLPGCMMCLVVHTVHRKKTHAPLDMINIHTYLSYHISNDSYRVLCVNRVYIHSWCSSQKSIDEIDATPVDLVNTPSFRAKIMIFHLDFPQMRKFSRNLSYLFGRVFWVGSASIPSSNSKSPDLLRFFGIISFPGRPGTGGHGSMNYHG